MREFNLEEAKNGKPVCTRCGLSARIIDVDNCGGYSVEAIVQLPICGSSNMFFTKRGRYLSDDEEDEYDLMMED